MKLRLIVIACSSMAFQECTPPSNSAASELQSVTDALNRLPSDPELAYETSGGLKVAFYSLYGTELRRCVEELPETKRAVLLESLIDINEVVQTTFIIRTFRELKLQMSAQSILKLSQFVSGTDKFSGNEAFGNELHLYRHRREQWDG